MPPTKSKQSLTYGEYLDKLFKLGLRLLPVTKGEKATHLSQWPKVGENRTTDFMARANGYWQTNVSPDSPADEVFAQGYNIGVNNEMSKVLTLDLDSESAPAAIKAGLVEMGLDSESWMEKGLVWQSVRGRKQLFRLPKGVGDGSKKLVVRRLVGTKLEQETIFELRTTGYDVLPLSYRADKQVSLKWVSDIDTLKTIPLLPDELVRLYAAMATGSRAVIHAMKLASGCDSLMLDADGTDYKYPPRLEAKIKERMIIGNRHTVPELLTKYGFRQNGKRWIEPDSTHADGVRPANGALGARGIWVCFHASSRVSGEFDAWRLFVEYEHDGNLDAAVKAANQISLAAVKKEGPTGEPAPKATARKKTTRNQPNTEKTAIAQAVTKKSKPAFEFVSVADMMTDYVYKEPPWVTEGTLPLTTGVYLFAADAKAGKSFMVVGLLQSACDGKEYMGMKFVKPHCGALYISCDDASERRFRHRMHEVEKSNAHRDKFHVHFQWPPKQLPDLTDPYDALDEYLTAFPDIRLVIIDTFSKFRESIPPTMQGVYYDDTRSMIPFREISNKHDVIILLVHHTNKGKVDKNDTQSILNSISGSMGLQGGTDGNLVLHRTDTDGKSKNAPQTARLVGRTRDGLARIDLALELKWEDARWHHLGSGWVASNYVDRTTILEILRTDAARYWTVAQIGDELMNVGSTLSMKTIGHILGRMKDDGDILAAYGAGGGFKIADKVKQATGRDGKPRKY